MTPKIMLVVVGVVMMMNNDGDVEEDDHDGQVHKASMVVAPTVMIHTLPIAGRPLR